MNVDGKTAGGMCRRVVWKVWQEAVCTREACRGVTAGNGVRRV